MIPGITPAISKKKAAAGGGYSFTMTAGDMAAIGLPPGMAAGYFPGASVGSINAEPIPGHPILSCISDSAGALLPSPSESISFEGDALSLLAGKSVWVDGVELLPIAQDWFYNTASFPPSTSIVLGDGSLFQSSQQYFIEIK